MNFIDQKNEVLKELAKVMDKIQADEISKLIDEINSAQKVYLVGVGRVLLSLKAIGKRLAHLGYNVYIVGQITEPAITEKDLLIVGSGSGESLIPLTISKKAKNIGARVLHIGSNENSSMKEFSDLFIRIPVQTKLELADEIKSIQPMTSLFEQSLLLLGDIACLMIINEKNIELSNLWRFHANLE